mmetsp:Transcript_17611/g.40746  ORF Transcript_17611/g.40746 Transcript_17611/m.40746 type:complete len:220 (-) Transcript_17611:2427-3086(-)
MISCKPAAAMTLAICSLTSVPSLRAKLITFSKRARISSIVSSNLEISSFCDMHLSCNALTAERAWVTASSSSSTAFWPQPISEKALGGGAPLERCGFLPTGLVLSKAGAGAASGVDFMTSPAHSSNIGKVFSRSAEVAFTRRLLNSRVTFCSTCFSGPASFPFVMKPRTFLSKASCFCASSTDSTVGGALDCGLGASAAGAGAGGATSGASFCPAMGWR